MNDDLNLSTVLSIQLEYRWLEVKCGSYFFARKLCSFKIVIYRLEGAGLRVKNYPIQTLETFLC